MGKYLNIQYKKIHKWCILELIFVNQFENVKVHKLDMFELVSVNQFENTL